MIEYPKDSKKTLFQDGKQSYARIETKDDVFYINLCENKKEFLDLLSSSEKLADAIIKESPIPQTLHGVNGVEGLMESIINLNIDLSILTETLKYVVPKCEPAERLEIIQKLTLLNKKIEIITKVYADLSELWYAGQIGTMHYAGANPTNYYSSVFEVPGVVGKILKGEKVVDKYGLEEHSDVYKKYLIRGMMNGKKKFTIKELSLFKSSHSSQVKKNQELEAKYQKNLNSGIEV